MEGLNGVYGQYKMYVLALEMVPMKTYGLPQAYGLRMGRTASRKSYLHPSKRLQEPTGHTEASNGAYGQY